MPNRPTLAVATALALAACASQDPTLGITDAPVPPKPTAAQAEEGTRTAARGLNTPITGAAVLGRVTGGARPPSLEAIQALRPNVIPEKGAEGMRAQAVCDAAREQGARAGLAARGFAINETLRRHEPALNARFDFSQVAVRTAGRSTLLLPPVVTEAQMAQALGEGGQSATETQRIYRITRQGRLTPTVPDWRSYLVRQWAPPSPPAEALLPRTDREAEAWRRCAAQGWAEGERLGTDTYLSDLATLESDFIGMARFHVLARAGVVEPPQVAVKHVRIRGGGGEMAIGDTRITITGQRGLNADTRRWRGTPGQGDPDSPIGGIGW